MPTRLRGRDRNHSPPDGRERRTRRETVSVPNVRDGSRRPATHQARSSLHSWDPNSPHLYRCSGCAASGDQVLTRSARYFGMRKIDFELAQRIGRAGRVAPQRRASLSARRALSIVLSGWRLYRVVGRDVSRTTSPARRSSGSTSCASTSRWMIRCCSIGRTSWACC